MVVTTSQQQKDPRAELERLRKIKRLRELEAKAGVEQTQPSLRTPPKPEPSLVDDEHDHGWDIDQMIDESIAIGEKAKRDKTQAGFPADNYDRGVRGYNALKETGIRGDLATRAGASAANSLLGFVDFASQPGRWVDDLIGAIPTIGDYSPQFVYDDKGAGFHFYKDLTDEQKGYTALPRIPMAEAENDAERAADMIGEGIGFIAPGAVVNKGMKAVGAAASKFPGVSQMVSGLTAKGSNAAARGSRYGQRMLSTVPEAGAQAFTFGASTADKSIIDEETGDVLNVSEDPVERGLSFATNPLSYVAPVALSGLYRAGVLARTGGKSITPKAVRAEVAPHILSATDEAVIALGDLPIPSGIKEADADKALSIMHRALKGGGVPDDVMAAEVKAYNELKGDRPAPAVWLRSRLSTYPKAIENLDNAIYEIGQKSPEVGAALRDMRTSQAQRLKDGLRDTLGKGNRATREAKLTDDLEELGEDMYEPILRDGPVDEEAATTLRALLNDAEFMDEIPAGYRTKLSMQAIDPNPESAASGGLPAKPGQAAGKVDTGPDLKGGAPMRGKIALQQRIEENPLEVAHKLYSFLGRRIREGNKKGTDTSKLVELRNTIRDPLFKAGGFAYREANASYRGAAQARDALSKPDKLFSQSLKSHEVAKVRAEYKAMKPAEKESYKISLKGLLEDELRRASASNDFVALGRMKREGVLDAIEEILDVGSSTKGTDAAGQIRRILDEQEQILASDPASRTNRNERMADGREAYAGKTGAMEHTGRYDLNALAQDAVTSYVGNMAVPGMVVPARAVIRLAQKAAAAMATPSRASRAAFARTALERPGMSPQRAARAAAARAKRQASAKEMYRKNGKFGGKAHIMDPEQPGQGGRRPFDEEGFAASMSDDGPPKIPGGGGSIVDDGQLSIIDEGYNPGAQPKQLPGKPKMLGTDRPATVAVKGEDKPEAPKSKAERYVDELRARIKAEEARADEAARSKMSERGKRREDERVARDAERLRAAEERVKAETRSEGLKAERERERGLRAQERARRAAEETEEAKALDVGPPDPKDNVFFQMGRARDRALAPAGDPRSLKEAMAYIVGEGERAAVSNNLRRFGRDSNVEWYNAPEINRANEVLRAAQGQTEGISPEVQKMVGQLNDANKKWLVDELSDPQSFDLLDIMAKIDELPPRGPRELEYGASGPFAAGAAALSALFLGGKAIYDAREKRTPEQVEASKRAWQEKMYGSPMDEVVWPDDVEIREWQKLLNRLKYTDAAGNKLSIDGMTGDRFREALRKFQDANDLPTAATNGGINKETIEFIRKGEF